MKFKTGLLAISAAFALASCNSDDAPVLSGRFVDAPVAGMAYRTPTLSGTTNANGVFSYRAGESVVFSIGGVDLPAVPGAAMVTPQQMAPTTSVSEPATLAIARFLQALDSDDNPGNGLTVVATRLLAGARTPASWAAADPATLVAAGVTVPSEAKAVKHLSESVAAESNLPRATLVGRYGSGAAGVAEIVAYHEASRSEFHVIDTATNPSSVQRISLANLPTTALANPTTASNLTIAETIDVAASVNDAGFTAGGVQSLDIFGNLMAVAVQANPKTNPGVIAFYRLAANGQATYLKKVVVGAQPDSVVFSPDGTKLLVPNEGELSNTFRTDGIDPEGSISIIAINQGTPADTATTLGFTDFNTGGSRASEVPAGYRIGRPGATLAQDTEPEYIAISPDSKTAVVTLQENNALAVVDLTTARITKLIALGYKDFGQKRNAIAPSDRAAKLDPPELRTLNNLFGAYMPDGISLINSNGKLYALIANEGDDRNDFLAAEETARLSTLSLDPVAFPNAANDQVAGAFGRLTVFKSTGTGAFGDENNDGKYDKLYVLGGRSFSVIDVATGQMVYDSGADFERIVYGIADQTADTTTRTALFRGYADRYDNKGPEPESIVTGVVKGRTLAFIGLERTSAIMMYDITNPLAPVFVQLLQNTTDLTTGDISPEGLKFVPADKSPNGKALLIAGYGDVSGTVAVYTID